MLEEHQDVFASFPQRRQLQGDDVEAVVEVAAEAALAAHGGEVRLGRGDHPAVHRDQLVGAQAFQLVLLQHPQQLDLQVQRHALDLVEEQAAAVGVLDLADAPLAGAGEGVGLVAEDFTVDQAFRQAAAVQRDEGLGLAPAVVVQAAGDQFLAGAGLAFDEHVGRGVGDVGDQLAQRLHRRRTADQPGLQGLAPGQLATQLADLAAEPAVLQGAPRHVHQALGGEGLFHEVVGAVAHGLHRHGDVAVAGDQHHRQLRVLLAQAGQQLQAVHAGQADVADDDAGEVGAHAPQRFLGAGHAVAVEVFQGQGLLAAEQHVGVVLDHQYAEFFVAHGVGS